MKKRVVVTGLGIVAPNGIGVNEFAASTFGGKSGIDFITRFDIAKYSVKTAAEVKNFDPVEYMPIAVMRKTDRFAHLGLAAAKLALDDAKLSSENGALTQAIVIIGSGQGGNNFHEETIIEVVKHDDPKKAAASSVPRITPNAVSAYIALQYGIKGVNQVISTACSSSAQAIGEACNKIRQGVANIAVTGGVEAPISRVTFAAYQQMMVLSPDNNNPTKASRPFDLTREGFVLGEGAGILILENAEHAQARGAHIYAEIAGFGSNCGAYHMVTPNPSGEDAAAAMKLALDDAGLEPMDVDYINAHGTSTKWNDLAETKAIKLVFNEYAKKIPISSIKSMIGHTIGAAGAIEAIICCLSIEKGFIPPTINLNTPDPDCDLDYVPNQGRAAKLEVVVSNSFGFGSNNAVLVFRRD
ncbi:MAG: beta-ketoacyl-[acyl-carrier-protein] synthase II [Omnitrophica bacterium RIFCSPLOWO2_12_FULL_44_17]|uniref:3-oxoacyl-[acyl-carrier-protein] synthase 2 n=1 Tax=Candidatus Danuiimicrobium aquiferis TaxID=1801832 RepID=A0A1G1KWG8_9BACT|nr:MAG: beta-ketoacyl-[acyl-carrier-protein] synthase II [Omnitrophica bacterium RIFCSPHIGHO2_02_FULL_45_28]OGW90296.1 MAG: beta-ketoacyl-[acyl-carrier-protein] synthase II [Omnitrophica bacterium RIFCSPHIGHO2_12_FULL_44_12]OGW97215.1 MAG: beta-ketoacyl-[acyl-carrier-protein] synthase II [Omnitrophica bacterium RIFCSPLOWO2_12_FULL_44_17]OGX02271.1 MAG: beta-ketoacyl-[acyl-carrier-protein] synthase II [Omnitrophica bacterium RIFCSPLOWO2_02_FULL_44_11]